MTDDRKPDETERLCDAAEASAGTTPYISNADPISDVAALAAHARDILAALDATRAERDAALAATADWRERMVKREIAAHMEDHDTALEAAEADRDRLAAEVERLTRERDQAVAGTVAAEARGRAHGREALARVTAERDDERRRNDLSTERSPLYQVLARESPAQAEVVSRIIGGLTADRDTLRAERDAIAAALAELRDVSRRFQRSISVLSTTDHDAGLAWEEALSTTATDLAAGRDRRVRAGALRDAAERWDGLTEEEFDDAVDNVRGWLRAEADRIEADRIERGEP